MFYVPFDTRLSSGFKARIWLMGKTLKKDLVAYNIKISQIKVPRGVKLQVVVHLYDVFCDIDFQCRRIVIISSGEERKPTVN